jgi:hypothetical protein
MKNCPECDAPQLEGSVFCLECGVFLMQDLPDIPPELTAVLPFKQFITAPLPLPVAKAGKLAKSQSKEITFVIPRGRSRVVLTLESQLYVGRADPEVEFVPDLDLTNDGGEDAGISRIHAVIQRTEEGVVLRDLNSTNGTLLNNQLLEPETSYLLNSGDEIYFGDLLVHILFD